jgi:predicted enzyme related to lactoylglutathione lyase
MPTRDTAPTGAPCWIDVMSSDAEATRSFYSRLFGWTALESSAEFGGYFMFARDGVPIAGGMPAPDGQPASGYWSVYLASENAEKTVEAATGAGAQVLVAPVAVGDLGTMAVLLDPTGAQIGVWQPGTFGGFRVLGEPGAPAWFELVTRDYDRAVAFYREVFARDVEVMSDTAEFRYTTIGSGRDAVAGIMDASHTGADEQPHWSVYFSVDDTDATVRKAVEIGGRAVGEAMDTPYGRMAVLTDPAGTTFSVMGPVGQQG